MISKCKYLNKDGSCRHTITDICPENCEFTPTPLDSEVEEAIEMMDNSFEITNFLQRKHVSNTIKQALSDRDKRIMELETDWKECDEESLVSLSKLNAIEEVVKEGDRRVYYTNEDKYNKIKQILKGDVTNEKDN